MFSKCSGKSNGGQSIIRPLTIVQSTIGKCKGKRKFVPLFVLNNYKKGQVC
jgi:hypothetical protein